MGQVLGMKAQWVPKAGAQVNDRRSGMSWTDERVETLKKMWAEGQSASQIAKELGGVTRNAVIGKVHRLGLSNRVGGKDDEEEAARPPPPRRRRARRGPAPNRAPRRTRRAPPPPAPDRPTARAPARANVTPLPIRKAIIPPASRCRRSPRPTRSAPRRWPRCARWKSARAS
jgi:GcrA cell cycle regulator